MPIMLNSTLPSRPVPSLSILHQRCRCQCGKMMGLFGNHYSNFPRFHSKSWLHNHVMGANYVCYCTLRTMCGVILSDKYIILESTNLAPKCPPSKPED